MGLHAVKENIAMGRSGKVGSDHHRAVLSWVKLQEEAVSDVAESKRDAREEETLSIAKEANAIARLEAASAARSARWAKIAAIIAAIGAIIANRADITWFVSWLID
jgi:hypothetical protein